MVGSTVDMVEPPRALTRAASIIPTMIAQKCGPWASFGIDKGSPLSGFGDGGPGDCYYLSGIVPLFRVLNSVRKG